MHVVWRILFVLVIAANAFLLPSLRPEEYPRTSLIVGGLLVATAAAWAVLDRKPARPLHRWVVPSLLCATILALALQAFGL